MRENENDQTAFFKIDIKEETSPIEWHGDCPKDVNPKKYFEAMEDDLIFLILCKMYDRAEWVAFQTMETTRLQAMRAWISAGHKNKIQIGFYKNGKPKYKYEIIEKQAWKSTHPESLKLNDEIDNAKTLNELKGIVKKVILII